MKRIIYYNRRYGLPYLLLQCNEINSRNLGRVGATIKEIKLTSNNCYNGLNQLIIIRGNISRTFIYFYHTVNPIWAIFLGSVVLLQLKCGSESRFFFSRKASSRSGCVHTVYIAKKFIKSRSFVLKFLAILNYPEMKKIRVNFIRSDCN